MAKIAMVRGICVSVCAAGAFFWAGAARTGVLPVPQVLPQEALSENVATAFAPVDWNSGDFAVEWEGDPIPGVKVGLERNSLQWTRVSEILVLPRGRLIVEAEGAEAGTVRHAGFVHSLWKQESRGPATSPGGGMRAELGVALVSGKSNPVELTIESGGQRRVGRLVIHFRPSGFAKNPDERVLWDTSCSRLGLKGELRQGVGTAPTWAYIGCRQIVERAEQHHKPAIELFIFWDGIGNQAQVNGILTEAAAPSLWLVRLNGQPTGEAGELALRSQAGDALRIAYRVPERMHLGALGAGIGPYQYDFRGPQENLSGVSPLLTLYGSYFFQENVRVVAFNATAFSRQPFTDLGVYLNLENLRALDRRISINLMLGGHVIGFRVGEDFVLRLGFPQGLEMVFHDALARGRNLSVGAFIYPEINGKAYSNVWVRWGGRVFGEFNYILWDERIRDQRVYSRSVGLSLGFPLFSFL